MTALFVLTGSQKNLFLQGGSKNSKGNPLLMPIFGNLSPGASLEAEFDADFEKLHD